mmetsp:Transcript_98327/g.276513  ORF Transcript_98327/g.276513 Transcript_98327/m.276513 type:complete len:304 (-) Transcript_98327:421-1332(-)
MFRDAQFGYEEVEVSVRNTFVHIAVQRTDSEAGDEGAQPGLSRATTAPASRLSDTSHEEEDEEQAQPDPGSESDDEESGCHEGGRDSLVLLGRLSDGGGGGHTAAPKPLKDTSVQSDGVGKPPAPSAAPQAYRAAASSALKHGTSKGQLDAHAGGVQKRTTVMLRNLPISVTREVLVGLLDAAGFVGMYDFLYMPIDFRTHAAMGYVFLNLTSAGEAVRVYKHFDGLSRWPVPSGKKTCSAGWSNPHQGLEANVERYLNSPLMHESVPDHYRPMLFSNGMRVPFPSPTKKVKPPRQGTQRMLL